MTAIVFMKIVCGKCGRLLVLDIELCDGGYNCVFSDFIFKIRLIRLGFSLSKKTKKFLYLNSQPTDSQ